MAEAIKIQKKAIKMDYEITEKEIFGRSRLLLGNEVMDRMSQTRVIIFGVGGVGSWCAESLIRSGIRHLTIVDCDVVCVTNCNRQLMATTKTIGQVKVEALKERLLEINPMAEITALRKVYTKENASEFNIETYDYVIDAIDSLKDKIALILQTTGLTKQAKEEGRRGPKLFSSMGAALRIDPTQVRVTEFWNVKNDTLGSVIRKKMRHNKTFPATKFMCVYSEELPMENLGENPQEEPTSEIKKAQTNGSLSHITGIFGFTLAGLVMKDIKENC